MWLPFGGENIGPFYTVCSPLYGQFKLKSPAIQLGQWSGGLYIETNLCPTSSIDVVLMLVT